MPDYGDVRGCSSVRRGGWWKPVRIQGRDPARSGLGPFSTHRTWRGVGCDRDADRPSGLRGSEDLRRVVGPGQPNALSAVPAGRPAGSGPVAGDPLSVPTQQRLWCDEPARSLRSQQGRRDSTQQGSVLLRDGWSVVQAVQHCELVTQHDDLKVLRASRANSQARQRHQQPVQNPTHRTPGCRRIMAGQRPRPHLGHPHAQTRPLDRPFDAARTGVPQRQEVIPRRLPGNPARVKTKASLRLG